MRRTYKAGVTGARRLYLAPVRILAQDLGSGATRLIDAPAPKAPVNGLLIRSVASLVSAGTERMLVDFGRANLLEKARQQPDRVRDVVDKARAEGVMETIEAVRGKLGQPLPLGYANAGRVIGVGRGVRGFSVGDLVATNGSHAEVVDVATTMAASVPEGVPAEEACFASVASVGLEGIRLAKAELGERFVVTGLGLIGLLTVQLLRAQGCDVMGVDPDPERRKLAETFGISTAEPGDAAEFEAHRFGRGRGVDGVLVCASTKSSDPVRAAARMCRQRGRIVLVGVADLDLERSEFYDKELTFQVSRAYGPGRYDPSYESGRDYPFGLVRWTAGRNMEAVLDLMGSGRLDVNPLITHRFDFDDAASAYTALVEDQSALGIVLRYPAAETPESADVQRPVLPAPVASKPATGRIALIGAGNFATRTLLPAIEQAGATVAVIAARGGVSAGLAADGRGMEATTDVDALFDDPSIGYLFVATRHDSHALLASRAVESGKAVYIEKPLAITHEELDQLVGVLAATPSPAILTVGFNRRFAPITVRMQELLHATPGPKVVIATVNAGAVPADHWTQDPHIGGGRIIGEACHFVDLARHLVGVPIIDVQSRFLGGSRTKDSASISLGFADGSIAAVHYLANGSARFPKERIEVFTQGRVLANDNFKTLHAYGWPAARTVRLRRQDKGHGASIAAFLDAARSGGTSPIPMEELIEVHRAVIDAATVAQ